QPPLCRLDATIENPIRMFNIEVEITDINDNAPHFRRGTMHLDISESSPVGERFSLNNAADPDVGTNSVKNYHLSASEHFSIEIQTGRDGTKFADLILKKALDREQQAVHNLMLTAVDGGVPTRTGTASIIVRVLDVNDNAPSFEKDKYVVEVMENSPIGSLVMKVNATDLDEGSNSDIMYSYSLYTSERTQQVFNLNSENGEIRVKEMINYEDFRVYEMEVTDMNDNHPEISIKSFQSPIKENEPIDTVIAVVSVSDKDSGDNGVLLDVNDNVPQFSQSFYTIRVMENNAPGALLSSLTAFDPDLHENQYLVYFILEKEIANTSMSMLFSINPENGNLYALKTFDYEIEKDFLFHIEARDSGSPPLSSNVTVHIIIVDQNDNAPVIVSPWRAHGSVVEEKIPRSTDKGSLVAKVIALDTDSVHNSRITYQFLQVTDATLFSLDQYNGEIRTMRMFNREQQAVHNLILAAVDGGVPTRTGTASIIVRVLDVNDNAPSFDKDKYVVEVMENSPIGSLVMKVNATDLDEGSNSDIMYSYSLYTSERTQQVFNLNSENGEIRVKEMINYEDFRVYEMEVNPKDGVLFVNQRVDREELCAKNAPCITNLKAVVENPLEMHQVIVEILDVNDNSPKFPEENYTLEVLESATVGSRFQMEGANDLDVGLNSLQSYKLNHNQYFRLEIEEFGEEGKVPFLILQRPLDRENADQHWLLLTATDGGKPFKSGTINITVIVSDINDNSPVCDKQKYTVTVKENAPSGTFLLTVNASDSDEGLNGEIEYSLRSKLRGLSTEPFDLDSRTGKLTVKGGLDYEEKQVYEIKVLAADKGVCLSHTLQCGCESGGRER
uniref:Cadherin domain-containing protein n=1 Tax=Labrus bergylta TaxID=56723 RepID=A0A3Q3E7P4_9LABR